MNYGKVLIAPVGEDYYFPPIAGGTYVTVSPEIWCNWYYNAATATLDFTDNADPPNIRSITGRRMQTEYTGTDELEPELTYDEYVSDGTTYPIGLYLTRPFGSTPGFVDDFGGPYPPAGYPARFWLPCQFQINSDNWQMIAPAPVGGEIITFTVNETTGKIDYSFITGDVIYMNTYTITSTFY